jgi:hypothetical protein
VLAAIPSFVIWCFSGLENSCYVSAVVELAVTLQRTVLGGRLLAPRVAIASGVLAALAAPTRPDGAIYAGAFPLVALLNLDCERLAATARGIVIAVAAFALPFGGYLTRRWFESAGSSRTRPSPSPNRCPNWTISTVRVTWSSTSDGYRWPWRSAVWRRCCCAPPRCAPGWSRR